MTVMPFQQSATKPYDDQPQLRRFVVGKGPCGTLPYKLAYLLFGQDASRYELSSMPKGCLPPNHLQWPFCPNFWTEKNRLHEEKVTNVYSDSQSGILVSHVTVTVRDREPTHPRTCYPTRYRGVVLSTHPYQIAEACIPRKDWTYDVKTHGSTIRLKLPDKEDARAVYNLLAKDYEKLTTHLCDAGCCNGKSMYEQVRDTPESTICCRTGATSAIEYLMTVLDDSRPLQRYLTLEMKFPRGIMRRNLKRTLKAAKKKIAKPNA